MTNTDILPTSISRLGATAVVVTTVLTSLAILLALTRLRIRRRDGLGIDDYVLLVALVFLTIQLVAAYISMPFFFSSFLSCNYFSPQHRLQAS